MHVACRRAVLCLVLATAALSLLAGGCGGRPEGDRETARRDRRGATPQETVRLVRETLERRRYRELLLHVLPDDRALFTLGRLQALTGFAESLEGEEGARRQALLDGIAAVCAQQQVRADVLRLGHEDALSAADLGALLDGLGALAARNSVDGLGGFEDLVPPLRDWQVDGDVATASAGEPAAPERWTFRRHGGAWYYAARE